MFSQEATESYFLGIFTVETSLKILAQGFVLHPGSLSEKHVEHHGLCRGRHGVSEPSRVIALGP